MPRGAEGSGLMMESTSSRLLWHGQEGELMHRMTTARQGMISLRSGVLSPIHLIPLSSDRAPKLFCRGLQGKCEPQFSDKRLIEGQHCDDFNLGLRRARD